MSDTQPKHISLNHIDFQTPVRKLLEAMGEDPEREGLKDTPKRFEKAIKYMLGGYDRNFAQENSVTENSIKYDDIILLKNINFFSICEHHFLPFFGYAHLAYIPSDDKYVGISKLARVVDIYARRLQDQERLGFEIAQAMMQENKAKGVAILLESRHFCNVARGVEQRLTIMSTRNYSGLFKTDKNLQKDFMDLISDRVKI